jgi:hypothetical protein
MKIRRHVKTQRDFDSTLDENEPLEVNNSNKQTRHQAGWQKFQADKGSAKKTDHGSVKGSTKTFALDLPHAAAKKYNTSEACTNADTRSSERGSSSSLHSNTPAARSVGCGQQAGRPFKPVVAEENRKAGRSETEYLEAEIERSETEYLDADSCLGRTSAEAPHKKGKHRPNRMVSDTSLSQFERMMQYNAKHQGNQLD